MDTCSEWCEKLLLAGFLTVQSGGVSCCAQQAARRNERNRPVATQQIYTFIKNFINIWGALLKLTHPGFAHLMVRDITA